MASSKEGEHGLKFDTLKEIMRQSMLKIYLVYNVFKAWRMQKSRQDVTVFAVISPYICYFMNTEEGKNNAIYLL